MQLQENELSQQQKMIALTKEVSMYRNNTVILHQEINRYKNQNGRLIQEKKQLQLRVNYLENQLKIQPVIEEPNIQCKVHLSKNQKKGYENIGGYHGILQLMQQVIVYPLKFKDKYIKFGIKSNRNLLLYGGEGCGKTLLVRSIAEQHALNLIEINCNELLTLKPQQISIKIRESFKKARQQHASILFFDEIQSIGCNISSYGDFPSIKDIFLSLFLSQLSRSTDNENICVIAATNRPQILDSSIIKYGYLDNLLYLHLPDCSDRQSILKTALKYSPVSKAVDLSFISRITEGFTASELVHICQQAIKHAINQQIQIDQRLKALQPQHSYEVASQISIGQITRRHFQQAFRYCRRGVSNFDNERFQVFNRKYQTQSLSRPNSSNKNTIKINWPAHTKLQTNIENQDDLYS